MNRSALIPCGITFLAGCAAAWGSTDALTESQALRLFRESPYHRELRAEVGLVRADNRRHDAYPNPRVSATFEGAGRTDFFVVEQTLLVNRRNNILRLAGESAVRVAETTAAHAIHQAEARLRRSFYRLVHAQGRKDLIESSVAELRVLVDVLRERETAGESSKFDRLRAELEVASLETEAAEAEAMSATARAELASFLGGRVRPEGLAATGTMEPLYQLPSLLEAFETALGTRSDYRVETERLEQLRLEHEAANRLRIPNPVVSGGLKRADLGGNYVEGPVVAVGIDLPLFDKGQADRALAVAKSERVRARQRVLEDQILADVRSTHDTLRIRRRIAQEYGDQMGGRTSELLEIARIAYEEGELGIFELLGALGDEQRTRLRLWDLQAEAKLAEVDFDRSVEREILP